MSLDYIDWNKYTIQELFQIRDALVLLRNHGLMGKLIIDAIEYEIAQRAELPKPDKQEEPVPQG